MTKDNIIQFPSVKKLRLVVNPPPESTDITKFPENGKLQEFKTRYENLHSLAQQLKRWYKHVYTIHNNSKLIDKLSNIVHLIQMHCVKAAIINMETSLNTPHYLKIYTALTDPASKTRLDQSKLYPQIKEATRNWHHLYEEYAYTFRDVLRFDPPHTST